MNDFSFSTDDDTIRLLEITAWCLKKYFNHTDLSATEAINNYYNKNQSRLKNNDWGDDFYHHEGFFRIALIIQYFEVLKPESNTYLENLNRIKKFEYNKTPNEALVYFRKNYYD